RQGKYQSCSPHKSCDTIYMKEIPGETDSMRMEAGTDGDYGLPYLYLAGQEGQEAAGMDQWRIDGFSTVKDKIHLMTASAIHQQWQGHFIKTKRGIKG
uniref:hypothetical protein n=4 Tax=Enterocloster clostridioformis TaxID=1531 RepID=UPI0026E36AB9